MRRQIFRAYFINLNPCTKWIHVEYTYTKFCTKLTGDLFSQRIMLIICPIIGAYNRCHKDTEDPKIRTDTTYRSYQLLSQIQRYKSIQDSTEPTERSIIATGYTTSSLTRSNRQYRRYLTNQESRTYKQTYKPLLQNQHQNKLDNGVHAVL